jgi:RimJ/RimL family protein N-acetyltransferase
VRLLVEKIRGEARQFPGVKKIIVDVDAANVPSRKTLEANNFVYNGSFYEFAF